MNRAGVSREHVTSVCLIDFKPLWRHYGAIMAALLRKENEKKNDIARLVCQAIGVARIIHLQHFLSQLSQTLELPISNTI